MKKTDCIGIFGQSVEFLKNYSDAFKIKKILPELCRIIFKDEFDEFKDDYWIYSENCFYRNDFFAGKKRGKKIIEKFEQNDENIRRQIINYIAIHIQHYQYNSILLSLIDILSSSRGYVIGFDNTSSSKKTIVKEYEHKEINSLIAYLKNELEINQDDEYSIANDIYLCWYLAITHKNMPKFNYGLEYQNDLDEFVSKVICTSGVSGDPAIINLINLSNKGNVFAKYELGELYYYGRSNIKKNLEKAYQLYREASFSKNGRHPLALWSLAYICMNYSDNQYGNELKNTKGQISFLDEMNLCERIALAHTYAKQALEIDGLACAANILGLINLRYGNKFTSNDKYSSEEYFRIAAEGGYVYGMNNYANEFYKKGVQSNTISDKENNYNQYIFWLRQSASLSESWSCNKLGRIYLEGINEGNGKYYVPRSFQNIDTYAEGKKCFEKACQGFKDIYVAWGYINLIANFYKDFSIDECCNMIDEVNSFDIPADELTYMINTLQNKITAREYMIIFERLIKYRKGER